MVVGGKADDGARRWGQAVVLHHTFGLKEADPPSPHLPRVSCVVLYDPLPHLPPLFRAPLPDPHHGIKKREMEGRTKGSVSGYKKKEDRLAAVSFCSHGPCCVPACQHCPADAGGQRVASQTRGALQKRSCPDSSSRGTPQTVLFSLARDSNMGYCYFQT